jgi:hypothetical protein
MVYITGSLGLQYGYSPPFVPGGHGFALAVAAIPARTDRTIAADTIVLMVSLQQFDVATRAPVELGIRDSASFFSGPSPQLSDFRRRFPWLSVCHYLPLTMVLDLVSAREQLNGHKLAR